LETKPQSQQRQAQETTPRAAHPRRRILTDLNKVNDTYKDSNSDSELKVVYDKVDCLQRSQVYIHNHISKVESKISELNILLRRLADNESHNGELN
jgi:hypothetical protein